MICLFISFDFIRYFVERETEERERDFVYEEKERERNL